MSDPVQAFARQVVDAFDEDAEHDRLQAERWATELAWHAWRLASCVEFNGSHDVRLRRSEIGGEVEVVCAHDCGMTIDVTVGLESR